MVRISYLIESKEGRREEEKSQRLFPDCWFMELCRYHLRSQETKQEEEFGTWGEDEWFWIKNGRIRTSANPLFYVSNKITCKELPNSES